MRRTTLGDTAHRSEMASASRATLREISHKHLWPQASKMDVMHSETSSDVEWAQNYGITSWPMKQDEQQQVQKSSNPSDGGQTGGTESSGDMNHNQPQGKSAEAVVIYANGSRSHPVIVAMGDRRHQLMFEAPDQQDQSGGQSGGSSQQNKGSEDDGKPGDTALHRTNDPDNQQNVHLATDGLHMLGVQGKRVRIGLVKKPDKMEHGQRPLYKKESKHFVDITKDRNLHQGKTHYLAMEGGTILVDVNEDGNVYLGAKKGEATFGRVGTDAGLSTNVYAKVS